jgi:hypothetical protein
MQKLQLKLRENIRKLYLLPALDRSLIAMSIGGIHLTTGFRIGESGRGEVKGWRGKLSVL